MAGEAASIIAEHASSLGFQAVLDRLTQAIEAAGLTLFAQIDHAQGALQAGLRMPPTVVLLYGAARGGTPIMLAHPQAALDLPLRVLVREAENGRTLISFHPVQALLADLGVPAALAARLTPAQQILIDALA